MKTILLTLSIICFVQFGMSQVCTSCLPYTDPGNSGKWALQSDFSDEFNDGTIDTSKWHIQGTSENYYNNWKGRAPSQFVPANVSESGKSLKITSKWQPGFNFAKENENGIPYGSVPITTGALITKKYIQNAYMEIRCKVGKSPMSGAYWGVDTSNVGELDVFEHVGQAWDPDKDNEDITTLMHSSFHSWKPNRPGGNNRVFQHKHKLPFDVTDGFHIYAADWTANFVRFYVDGKLIREITKAQAQKIIYGPTNAWVVDTPMRLWIDSEIFNWEGALSKLTQSMFNDAVFEIDYVRVWKRDNSGSTTKKGHGLNLVKNGSFNRNLNQWNINGTASRPDISAWKFWKDDNPSTDNFAMQLGGGQTTARQTIDVEPNTTYMLTAYMRMPSTTGSFEPTGVPGQDYSTWHNGYYGVENYGGAKIEKKLFLNYWLGYSIEFKTGPNSNKATVFFDNKAAGVPMHIDEVSVVKLKKLNNDGNNNVPVIGISVSPKNLTLKTGSKGNLTGAVMPANASIKTMTFTSSNPAVASVNQSGDVTAIKNGTAIITLKSTDGSFTTTARVTVSNITPPPTGLGEFYIANRFTGLRLRPTDASNGSPLIQVAKNITSDWVKWEKINTNNGWYYLKNIQTGKYFRPQDGNKDGTIIEQQPSSFSGKRTQWKDNQANNGFVYLINRASGKHIRPKNDKVGSLIELAPNTARGDWAQWSLQPVGFAKSSLLVDSSAVNTEVSVYPNPTKGTFYLNISNMNQKTPVAIDILNMNGHVVHSLNISEETTKIEANLPIGVYILKVRLPHDIIAKKIIVE